eukprot:5982168-Amphidinium_carterae.1
MDRKFITFSCRILQSCSDHDSQFSSAWTFGYASSCIPHFVEFTEYQAHACLVHETQLPSLLKCVQHQITNEFSI